MRWSYTVPHKLKTAMLLVVVLAMVFINNIKERLNAAEINATMTSIYDDRLMVQSYIFQYLEYMNQVVEVIDNRQYGETEKQQKIAAIGGEIAALHEAYRKTRLTPEEEAGFVAFNRLCENIQQHAGRGALDKSRAYAKEADSMLKTLSTIQLTEAKSLMSNARRLFSSGYLSSQFEMAALVIIALMIQALLFASKSIGITGPQHLN